MDISRCVWAKICNISSARISKKVEGEIGIEIGYFFNAHPPTKGGITQVERI